jgi:hypothetical protein
MITSQQTAASSCIADNDVKRSEWRLSPPLGPMGATGPNPNFMHFAVAGRIEPYVTIQCRGPDCLKLWFRMVRCSDRHQIAGSNRKNISSCS